MSYSIWIVKSPRDLDWHTRCFAEVAIGLQSALRELGHEAPIVHTPSQVKGTAIVLAPHLLAEVTEPLPKDMILYNFEQIHPESIWLRPQYRYLEFLRAHPVLDYSRHNIEALQALGVTRIAHLGVGYAPELTRIAPQKEDIDVLFIGTRHPRRAKVIDELKARGLKVEWISNLYGPERDAMIARSKLVLNMHLQPTQLFEIVRVSYLLANSKCVISETGRDDELEKSLEKAVVFAAYDDLADTCQRYIKNAALRKKQAKRGFEIFSKMKQAFFNPAANAEHLSAGSRADPVLPLRGPQDFTRIFIAIASYRDPECQHTVKDLFDKAAHPERVHVGICWQYDPKEDSACFDIPPPRPEQVRVIQYHHRDSRGANWARAQAMGLRQGEDCVLVIDSHMRFDRGWDELLLQALKRCPSEKPVLTAWLPGYKPPRQLDAEDEKIARLRISRLGGPDEAQLVNLNRYYVPAKEVEGRMDPAPGIVANCIFAPARAFEEAPFDPHIDFWGDEINQSARLWTRGWDFFQLDRRVLYHHWDPENIKDRESYRDRANPRHQRARKRNLHLFGLERCNDPEALTELAMYSLGKARPLAEYWRFIGVDWTQRKLLPPPPAGGGKIFIAIASYRDPECRHTLKDLFKKAAHPERIRIGICLQADPVEDKDCLIETDRPQQVRIKQLHWKDSHGANWARAEAAKLWNGEEYILQIDSHMRFEPGWDAVLIDMLARCPSEKPVISAYLPNYDPPDKRDRHPGQLLRIRARKFGGEKDPQLLHITGAAVPASGKRGGLYPSPFYVANFMFARSEVLKTVPIDLHIHFYGDEISYAARLWTHGYDIFQPDRVMLFHYWVRKDRLHLQHYRNTRTAESRRSRLRVRHLLGFEPSADAAALAEMERYGLGRERRLEDLWAFAGIDWPSLTMTKDALEGRWNMAARDKGRKKKKDVIPNEVRDLKGPSAAPRDDMRIFVQIASYRDPDCQHTVKDLFDKAAHPERIFVGICWQFVKKEDAICFEVPYPYPDQVRVHEVDAKKSKGVCWARSLTQALWQGEEFTLQIDSHMRFEPGWDDMLIDMWKACGSEKAILTCYPPGFTPPDKLDRDWIFGMSAVEFDEHGIFKMRAAPPFAVGEEPQKPIAGAYLSGCMFFGPGSIIQDVPYDPYLYFFGEEIMMAVRLWTHGYDIYHPNHLVIYHDWDRGKRPTHFSDYRDWGALNDLSMARVRHLLKTEPTRDKETLKEIDKYGLGTARTLEEYETYSGVNFAARTIAEHALNGEFSVPAPHKVKETLPRIFVQIPSYRDTDCQHTVKDLFDKAAHPERIFVGICWQFVKDEDAICFEVPYPYPDQVRVHEVNAKESRGMCWARSLTQALWQGEEFTLSMDAHMRFEPGWDDLLIDTWKACENDKAIITSYPPAFTPPNDCNRQWIFGMGAKEFDKNSIFLMEGKPGFEIGKNTPAKPIPGAFIGDCMLFGPSSMIQDVPFDPHLYFFGQEISVSVRLWTSGYDIYHPNKLIVFHDWDRSKRKTHFSDHRDWGVDNDRAYARVRHMLGTERSDKPEVIAELDKYGLGKVRSLKEYQRYSGVNFQTKTIAEHARKGEFINPAANAKRLSAGSGKDPVLPLRGPQDGRIFVNIASYRDPECQWTIKDLFEKAKNPDRIYVGVCWQFDPEADQDCFQVSTRPDQVRMLPVDWREGEGVCWARHQAQQLWDGEEYTLQIDAHMRFVPGWDELMIGDLHACDAEKPVLSCNPASYQPPDKLEKHPRPTVRRAQPFFPDGNVRGKGELLDRAPEKPLRGAFIAAGFVFSRSEIISEVPYDPYLYFDQEEIAYAARLFTHGWEVFSTRRPMLYHYYNDLKVPGGSVRPLHWRDLRQQNEERIIRLRDRGMTRLNHLTGFQVSHDAEVTQELTAYGFGNVRTLQQFEEFSGIDFKRKVASERALRCQFIEDLRKYRDHPIYIPELDGQSPPTWNAPAAAKPARHVMLEPGDFIPLFEATDTENRTRAVEMYGGRYSMLFFLPSDDPGYVVNMFQQIDQQLANQQKMNIWQSFILDGSVEKLNALKEKTRLPHVLWADSGSAIAQAFGLCKPGEAPPPAGFLLSPNLKIIRRYLHLSPEQMATSIVADCRSELEMYRLKNRDVRTVSEMPPALIVPNALSPELCEKALRAFHGGHTFDGTVGAGAKLAYRPDTKIRTDHIVANPLLDEIDDKLSRSLFPEIKKVFGLEVTQREIYKVGMYAGDKGGFFKQHRDNFDKPLGYRRLAMTLHLNDDYVGGGLRFPEYDDHVYRPPAGSAVIFSCATLHEALAVTGGQRFILVGFFHGDEDEAYRRQYLADKGQPLKIKDYTPALRSYPSIQQSRSFYHEWRAEHVHIDVPGATTFPATVRQDTPMSKPTAVTTLNGHQPKKVYESKTGIIFDDFLPEDVYEQVNNYALTADYERINTQKVTRAWHVHDGFPLRSTLNAFYHVEPPDPKPDYIYPTKTPFDSFFDHLRAIQPQSQHMIGKEGKDWMNVSATAWIYPHGTGLSMHDDGSGVYAGAYVYFLNPEWRPHWGGLLIMADEEANRMIHEHRAKGDQMDFYKRKWLHANAMDDLLMEHGFGKCIFPRKNRLVFIANDAYHMVTRVNEQAGDHLRMSIAGFFNRKKS